MRSLPADVLVDLERVFRRLRVGWYLFGAQAATMHGVARLTIDVDVTVALGDAATQSLADALNAAGFALRITDDEFVQRTRVLPAVHTASGIPVDIVLAGPGIEELFLERAELREIRGVPIPVACPEDIVAMKVLAGRPKDIDDVVAILRATGNTFRRGLARATLELLEHALDRGDLLPGFEAALKAARPTAAAQRRSQVEKAKKGLGGKRRSTSKSRQKRSPKKAR